MVRLLPLLSLIVLAACNRTPSFDDKYKEQSEHISAAANSIETQVTEQISGAAEADRAAAELSAQKAAPGNSAAIP